MKRAIYAFSGDPITFGHIDIINRAAATFDEVLVGIGSNPDKKYTFSLEERTRMAEEALKSLKNVQVQSFRGLLVDYAYEQNISVIVKGVRNSADFDYENILHQVGESQKLGIDTFILFARPHLSHISSSAVKSIIAEHGFIHEYVPLSVKQNLELKMCDQFIVGVTGEIGTGKSYITDQLVKLCEERGVPAFNIDLDIIGHQILEHLIEPQYQEVRNELTKEFGSKISTRGGMISRKALGQIVFNNAAALQKLNNLMVMPILVRLKRELYDKKGIIILNGALLAEARMLHLCNNNMILVTCEKSVQQDRLKKRNLSSSQIARRIKSQYSFSDKKKIISSSIRQTRHGNIWIIDNSGPAVKRKLRQVSQSLCELWREAARC